MPSVAVTVSTYMGWNQRAKGYSEGDLYNYYASEIRFPAKQPKHDRLALPERYMNIDAYEKAVQRQPDHR